MCAPVRDPGDKTMTIAAAQNNAPPADSYACGATEVPLIEQTIGAFFADMVARQPEREALVSDPQFKKREKRFEKVEFQRMVMILSTRG
jgi:fatty-acyl-CoA synthase